MAKHNFYIWKEARYWIIRIGHAADHSLRIVGRRRSRELAQKLIEEGGLHCRGCYDPALCSGTPAADGTEHCTGCVLDDSDHPITRSPDVPISPEAHA